MAQQQGCERDLLAQEAFERLVGYEAWFIREAEKGLAQVQNGDVLEYEEVAARIENLIAQKHFRT